MQEDLIALILADAGVTAAAGTNVWWMRRPQGQVAPFAILQMVSSVPAITMTAEANWTDSRVQVDCYGPTYAVARGVARAVAARLGGYSGTAGTTAFQGVFRISERDLYEAGETEADRLYRVMLEFRVIWRDAS
jgi:hypothetical protein